MSYRNGNYCAFYVSEPFNENNLGANSTPDFLYYNLFRMWKAKDKATFSFVDSHNKTYNVRDGSDWEKTLKPRLHERLKNSKNIILFLSSTTKESKALREEIDYGVNILGLPIIIIYPEYSKREDLITSDMKFKVNIVNLWKKLPVLESAFSKVPTLHIPLNKKLIVESLLDERFIVNSNATFGKYIL